ncbi:GLUG motif-containing protein [Natrarchaeobius sp. A-rgal3]|uniref:GLUG motif-containing protein n=1 Tax=Natrarchaeobius versutus TaxID=1679078 RepID=UPI00350EDE28
MRRAVTTAIIVGLLALALAFSPLAATAIDDDMPSPEAGGDDALWGTITDGITGEALEGVEVTVSGDVVDTTDVNGQYATDEVLEGTTVELSATTTVDTADAGPLEVSGTEMVETDRQTGQDLDLWPELAGEGTTDEPYEISNAYELQAMSQDLEGRYVLVENVDASEMNFEPVGDADEPFTGAFDGQGHAIDGVTIDGGDDVGLVGNASDATIENVGLENADVSGDDRVGTILGAGEGTNVDNVYATGSVDGMNDVGGLVGSNDGEVETAFAAVEVNEDDSPEEPPAEPEDIGGAIGSGDGSAEDVYWDESVSGETESAGGESATTDELTGSSATETLESFDFADDWIATEDYPRLQGSVDDYALALAEDELEVGANTTATVTLERAGVSDFEATEPADLETNENLSVDGDEVTAERGGTGVVTASASGFSDEATVSITAPAALEVAELDVPDAVAAGETLSVTATIENAGTEAGETDVVLEIGDEETTENVTLEGGETETVSAEYDVDADAETGSLEVSVATDDADEATTVDVDGEETLSGTVTDGATGEALSGLEIRVDGDVVDETGVNGEFETGGVLNDSTVELSAETTVETADVGDLEISTTETVTIDGETEQDLELWPELAGVGTDETPYQITNAYELQAMSQDLSGNYTLETDVDASDTENWNDEGDGPLGFDPVGDSDVSFNGSLDGQNNSIEGVTIDGEGADNVGLFGTVSDATIEKITITDIDLSPTGSFNVGGVVGRGTSNSDLTISETYVTGDINTSNSNAGGIVGRGGVFTSAVHLSNSSSAVNVTTDEYAGGAIGYVHTANISNSHTSGDVEGEDSVGGLVGRAVASGHIQIQNSSATGTVTGHDRATTGGLVGTLPTDSLVVDSFASGNVYSDLRAGGLIGDNRGEISESYATGDVEGHWQVGGLVGENDGRNNGEVTESYSTGDVDGKEDVDGIDDSVYVGGLIGENDGDGDVDDSYWDDEAAKVTEDGEEQDGQGIGDGDGDVTALSTDQMTGANATGHMDDLDFEDTWIAVDEEYPIHTWQVEDYALEGVPDELEVGETAEATVVLERRDGASMTATEASSYETDGNVSVDAGTITGEHPGPDTITASAATHSDSSNVTALGADVQVSVADAPEAVASNQSIDVEVALENAGNVDEETDVTLAFEGEQLATEPTTLEAGAETTTVLTGAVPADAERGEANLTVAAGDAAANATVEVRDAEPVSGTVTDGATGEPVSALELEIDGERIDDEPVLTDENGSYAFDAVNGTSLTIAANDTVEGVDLEATESVEVDGETTADLELWPALAGSGTAEQPFEISNAHELQAIDRNVSAHYVLVENVSASETAEWNADGDDPRGFDPIGSDDAFAGTFDGDGHAVSGLSVDRSDRGGLFYEIDESATVERVTLEDVDVEGSVWTGALAGQNDGEIRNVTATGDVDSGGFYTGGLVGYNDGGRIVDSSANVSVTGSHHTPNVGGLVGRNGGEIDRSAASGSAITSTSSDGNVGGLVGRHDALSSIDDSYATATVSGSQDTTGGLVGQSNGPITGSFAAGLVDDSGLANRAGGLVGANGHDLERSYWDTNATTQSGAVGEETAGSTLTDVTGVTTTNATGVDAAVQLSGLEFTDAWRATEAYPRLAWEEVDALEGVRITALDAPATVEPGETLEVETTVVNVDEESPGELTITIDGDDDLSNVTSLESLAPGERETLSFAWVPDAGDAGSYELMAATADDTVIQSLEVDDPFEIDGMTTIDEPGEYELVSDIEPDERPVGINSAINITADDVTLDGAGHTVAGHDTAIPTGINVEGDNVTVTNLTVEEWGETVGTGVQYFESTDGTISNVTAIHNANGVIAAPSTNITIDGVEATHNNQFGIGLGDVENASVTRSTASHNAEGGIFVDGSINSTLSETVARDNDVGDLALSHAAGTTVERLDLGHSTAPNTTISFEAGNASLRGVGSDAAIDNPDATSLSRHVDGQIVDLESVELYYEDDDVEDVPQEEIRLWSYDDDADEWTELEGTTIDADANAASVDELVDVEGIGLFAPQAPASVTVDDLGTNSPVAEDGLLSVDATVQNVGDEDADRTITLEADGQVVDSADVSLAGGETETVSLEWDAADASPGEYDVIVDTGDETASQTVTVLEETPAEAFVAVELTEAPAEVDAGEPITLEYALENTGDDVADQEVDFVVDGAVEETVAVALEPGETQTGSFTYATDAGDEPELVATVRSGDDTDDAVVTVAEDDPAEAQFAVEIDAIDEVTEGDVVSAVATVTNTGDAAAEQDVTLTDSGFGDEIRDVETISLEPNETAETTLTWRTDRGDAGTGDLTVSSDDDAESRPVTVAVDPIVEDGDVLEAGGTYELAEDIDDGIGLEIVGDDIVLEGDGNTIAVGDGVGQALRIDDVENVTVRNLTIVHSADAAVEIGDASGVSVDSLTLNRTDENGVVAVTLSFGGENVAIGAGERPFEGPEDREPLGRYFEATATNGGELTDLELVYEDDDVTDLETETITLWKYDSSAENWTEVEGSTVDTDAGVVAVDAITSFSTFGAYAEPIESDSGGGGSSGGGSSGGGGGGGGAPSAPTGGDDDRDSAVDPVSLELPALAVDDSDVSDDGTADLTIPIDEIEQSLTTDLELRVDGETVATLADVELVAGTTTDLEFDGVDLSAFESADYEYELRGDGVDGSGTLTLSAPAEERELSISVLDADDGSPIEDATVEAGDTTVRTDGDGSATITDLEDGEYAITASTDGYADGSERVEIDGGDAEVVVELEVDDSTDDADDVPGFGIGATFLAVVALLAIAIRSRR